MLDNFSSTYVHLHFLRLVHLAHSLIGFLVLNFWNYLCMFHINSLSDMCLAKKKFLSHYMGCLLSLVIAFLCSGFLISYNSICWFLGLFSVLRVLFKYSWPIPISWSVFHMFCLNAKKFLLWIIISLEHVSSSARKGTGSQDAEGDARSPMQTRHTSFTLDEGCQSDG